jgi:hypothetical protein
MARSIRLVIPDSGVLISLAQGDLLDLLTVFHAHIQIVITDVVEYEVRRRIDIEDAQLIRAFLSRNAARIQVEATSFGPLLRTIRDHPEIQLPDDVGELSIYSYINTTRKSNPGEATLILFEDDWFIRNAVRPGNAYLLSTHAFLDGLERIAPEFSSTHALNEILKRRPAFQFARLDDSASKIPGGTEWQPAVDVAAIAKVGRRRR